MIVILLGPPGAGKGTQADVICQHFKIPKISTGDILRVTASSDTAQGRQLKVIMDAGLLVEDKMILEVIRDRLQQPDCKNGALFDGFPRTIEQARGIAAANIHVDYVIELRVPDQEIIRRLAGRRIHPASGRIYHIESNPPKHPGLDDQTNEPLVQRQDDSEDVIRKRLAIYHSTTQPLVAWYETSSSALGLKIISVDGTDRSVEEVRKLIFSALE